MQRIYEVLVLGKKQSAVARAAECSPSAIRLHIKRFLKRWEQKQLPRVSVEGLYTPVRTQNIRGLGRRKVYRAQVPLVCTDLLDVLEGQSCENAIPVGTLFVQTLHGPVCATCIPIK
jgi:hypothetical protein